MASYFRDTGKPNPFKDGVPGKDWWKYFMKWHPELSMRKPQALQMIRARSAMPEIINHWFNDVLKPTLDRLGLAEKPHCIYNVDESGFPLSGRPAQIICQRGLKSPQTIIGGSGRENINVQVCVNAYGTLLAPYIVFTGKHLMANCTNGGPLATRYAVSPNGWMTNTAYIDWFKNLFLPSIPSDRPILLILDGHSSYISYEVRKMAIENQIHMLKLPPHLTHLLQPLNVGVFKPLKAKWYSAVADFTRKECRTLTKRDFPPVLKTIREAYNPETARGGFKGCGIYPFDSSVIKPTSTKYSEPFNTSTCTSTSTTVQLEHTCTENAVNKQITGQSPSSSGLSSPDTSMLPALLTEQLEKDQESHFSDGLGTPSLQLDLLPETNAPQQQQEHLTPTITPPVSSTPQNDSGSSDLKNYFGRLLTSSRPQIKTTTRRRLIGIGESLTSDEAMELLEKDLEEKRQKEEDKQRRKRQKKEKRQIKLSCAKGTCKRRKSTYNTSGAEKQSRAVCKECEMFYDLDDGEGKWIECGLCSSWYHAECVGIEEQEADDIEFICDTCK